jgi:hypothetical protein
MVWLAGKTIVCWNEGRKQFKDEHNLIMKALRSIDRDDVMGKVEREEICWIKIEKFLNE